MHISQDPIPQIYINSYSDMHPSYVVTYTLA